jgi:hypothetical protein
MEFNKFQTPLNDALLKLLPEEVQEQLLEILNSVEFVKRLVSPNRPYAKDLPRDSKGRIIVDITNPHILTDMDYFRKTGLFFQKNGCYTFLRPNSNPNSEYRKFWDEEIRRCREGYVRESDGEWVTGYMYFYLNYSPIMLNIIQEGSKKAVRVSDLPEFWEGIYWRFHYLEQARNNGHHAIELARRGAHPYYQKVYTPNGIKEWGDIKVGDSLYGTHNNITKVIDIPFDAIADIYKITLRDGREVYASDDHLWNIVRKNSNKQMLVNTLYLKDKYKLFRQPYYRVPSGVEYVYFIPKNDGVSFNSKLIPIDSYTLGFLLGDGCFRTPEYKNQVIFSSSKEDIETYKKYIPYEIYKVSNDDYTYAIKTNIEYLYECGLWMKKSEDKFIPDLYKYNNRDIRLNVLKGLLDADGHIHGKVPTLSTTSEHLKNDVIEIARSLGYNCFYTKQKAGYVSKEGYKQCLDVYSIQIYGGEELFNLQRKKNLVNIEEVKKISRYKKSCIVNIEYVGKQRCKCVTVDAEDNSYLIGDFIQTHNCSKSFSLASMMTHNLLLGENEEVVKRVTTILTAYQKEFLADKDGTLSKFTPMLNHCREYTPFPRLMLRNSPNTMLWQMGYKDEYQRDKGSLNTVMGVSSKDDEGKLRGKRGYILIEEMGSFPNLLSIYDVIRYGVEEGDYTFGLIYLVGTAAQEESDFTSAKTLLYNPKGYNIQEVVNVYDKPNQGKLTFGFFFPSYINRKGCYNKDGVSDVIKALIQILMNRYRAKYSADPKSLLRVIAEMPITPAEAIIQVKTTYFPTVALTERLAQIDSNPNFYDDTYIGNLVLNKNNEVEFKPSNDTPIRQYGVSNSTVGAIEIYEMPEKNKNGEVFENRYIVGHDPVDNDQAESTSLSSTIVFDLYTDKIVAEYTGRQPFADDNFEILRLLCIFYNAVCLYENNKKGCYAYFKKMQSLRYLSEAPEYLRDKNLIKYSSFGSSAYGVNASAAINMFANSLIRDWLLKLVTVEENGEEHRVPQLTFLKNRALIEELIAFNPELNVDRIRALGMVMLKREEKIIMYGNSLNKEEQEKVDNSYLGNDDYFSRNYDNRFNKNIYSNQLNY